MLSVSLQTKLLWGLRGYGFSEVWVKRVSTVVKSHVSCKLMITVIHSKPFKSVRKSFVQNESSTLPSPMSSSRFYWDPTEHRNSIQILPTSVTHWQLTISLKGVAGCGENTKGLFLKVWTYLNSKIKVRKCLDESVRVQRGGTFCCSSGCAETSIGVCNHGEVNWLPEVSVIKSWD